MGGFNFHRLGECFLGPSAEVGVCACQDLLIRRVPPPTVAQPDRCFAPPPPCVQPLRPRHAFLPPPDCCGERKNFPHLVQVCCLRLQKIRIFFKMHFQIVDFTQTTIIAKGVNLMKGQTIYLIIFFSRKSQDSNAGFATTFFH